jgi:hypothetical protein
VTFAYRRRAIVDAYCLQHPAYIESVKSFAAHFCGLCVAVERPHDPRVDRAIWSTLTVPPNAAKPPIPVNRGSLTVANIVHACDAREFRHTVDAWIVSVWNAWRDHHELARAWLDYSVRANTRPRQRGA